MRRTTSTILAGLLALTLTACNGGEDNSLTDCIGEVTAYQLANPPEELEGPDLGHYADYVVEAESQEIIRYWCESEDNDEDKVILSF